MQHINVDINFEKIRDPDEDEFDDISENEIYEMIADSNRIEELLPHIKWYGSQCLGPDGHLDCVIETHNDRIHKAIDHGNLVALEWLWACSYEYEDWYPQYHDHLMYAAAHARLEIFQHVLHNYREHGACDESGIFLTFEQLQNRAKINKDTRIAPYIKSLFPLTNILHEKIISQMVPYQTIL